MRTDALRLPFTVSELGEATTKPVLIIPGGPCRGPEYLGDFADLGATHRLVVMHPRGTPLSPGLSAGWWSDASDVIALIDALELPCVDIIAHSAGTRLALSTSTRYPDRVRSLALITPPASWLTGTPHDGDDVAIDRSDEAVTAGIASLKNEKPSTEESYRTAFRRQAAATYAHWNPLARAHADVGAVSLAAETAWFTDIPADAAEQITRAPLPRTLVVGGDRDLLTGIRPVADYAAALRAEIAWIAECGHYPWVERPDEFRRILEAWLSRGDA